MTNQLHILLRQLDVKSDQIEGWQVQRITGGANNLLYRATNQTDDLAIKFTINDARDRAGREYNALCLLADLDLAPRPILLDRESYSQPVVVQTWLQGEVSSVPPVDDAEWLSLLRYLSAIHQITPPENFTKPVLYAESPAQCLQIIRDQLNRLPDEVQTPELKQLTQRFLTIKLPQWQQPQLTLVRSDPNPSNFIRRAQGWASVDWEYSGITDPAFEIADLIAHAAYLDVPLERWEWVLAQYDDEFATRVRFYWLTMVVWWVVRFERYAYEIPRGLDQRLVQPDPNAREIGERKRAHYVELAHELLR